MSDKKPGTVLIAVGDKPKAEKPVEEATTISAVKDLAKALKAENWEAADEALKLHYSLCDE